MEKTRVLLIVISSVRDTEVVGLTGRDGFWPAKTNPGPILDRFTLALSSLSLAMFKTKDTLTVLS